MKVRETSSGFTLLELMVTLAIMGIVAGIAAPNFLSYIPKSRLNGAASMIMTDMMLARMKAINRNTRFQIYFSGDHEYKICDDADGDGTVTDCEGDALIKDIQETYGAVTFTSTNNPIFLPRGTASNLATVTISNAAGSKTLTVAITGIVRMN